MKMIAWFKALWVQRSLLFLLAVLVYANTISHGFNLDDDLYTKRVQDFSDRGLLSVFKENTFRDELNTYDYRPVAMLTFVLQHRVLNDSAGVGHVINILLYAITGLLIFSMLRRWFKGKADWLPFITCLLFLVHPLHTEIVNSIKSRDELLAMLLGICALLAAWRWRESGRISQLLLVPLFFLLALLCKTTILTLILVLPASFFFFAAAPAQKDMLPPALMIAVVILLLVWKGMGLPDEVRVFLEQDNPAFTHSISFGNRLATSVYILGWYLYLHILPYPLVYFYGYNHVPVTGWSNALVWLSLAIHMALLFLIIKYFRKKTPWVFGGVLYFIAILPFSNLILPVPGIMGERFTYLSSLGFSIAVCCALYTLVHGISYGGKRIVYRILAGAALIFGIMTVVRNTQWKNKETLFTHDMPFLENSAKANMLYGDLFRQRGTHYMQLSLAAMNDPASRRLYRDSAAYCYGQAKEGFTRATAIVPSYAKAWNNLGAVYFLQDSFAVARQYLLQANSLAGNDKDLLYNLGVIYLKTGHADSATYMFDKVLAADSLYFVAYREMSNALLHLGDTGGASRTLRTATIKFPGEAAPYAALANIALYRRDTLSAVAWCEQAAALPPPNMVLLSFLRDYFAGHGDTAKAGRYAEQLRQFRYQKKQ